jgi:hypothetical protein
MKGLTARAAAWAGRSSSYDAPLRLELTLHVSAASRRLNEVVRVKHAALVIM